MLLKFKFNIFLAEISPFHQAGRIYGRCGVTFGLELKMVKDSTQQISAATALISLNVNNRQEGRERKGNGIRREEEGWVFVVVVGRGVRGEPINILHLKPMKFSLNQKNNRIFRKMSTVATEILL